MAKETGKDPKPETEAQGKSNEDVIEEIATLREDVIMILREDVKALEGLRKDLDLKGLAVKIREDRLDKAVAAYKRRGTMVPFINTLRDLNEKQKKEFFDDGMTRAKGAPSKKGNPFGFIKLGILTALSVIGVVVLLLTPMVFGDQNRHSTYPNGFPNGVTIRNMPILNSYTGNVWYVDSGTGSNGNKGTYRRPFATVDYCIGRATGNNGDICAVFPGHAESYDAADGFDIDVAGVAVVGLGNGTDVPEFTFADTDATIACGAANATMMNLRFLAGISAITIGIAVEDECDNFTFAYNEFPEPTNSTFEFIDAIDLETGVAGAKFIGNTYFNADATGGSHWVEMGNGANTNIQFIDNYVYGEFLVSAIWSNDTDLEILIQGGTYTNLTNDQHAIEFVTGATTGQIIDVLVRTNAQGTAVDPGSMTMKNVLWDDDTSADTVAIPVVGVAGGVVDTSLAAIHLDHLMALDGATQVYPEQAVADSTICKILGDDDPAVCTTYDNSTDSLEAISVALAAGTGVTTATAAIFLDNIMALDGATQVYPENAVQDSTICKILGDDDPAVCTSYNNATDSLEAIGNITAALNSSFATTSLVQSDAIPNNTQVAGAITGAAAGNLWLEDVVFLCDTTGFANGTNIELSVDNVYGPRGADEPIFLEVMGSFGGKAIVRLADATSHEFPMHIETGKIVYIHADDAAPTGTGKCLVVLHWTSVAAGSRIVSADLP